ncbi:hypothetical protein [Mastigocladopsis repens]|uniref:hypothetical protein n=1 Tax=Mastigocladopsis repens TaxID=221287 RepID=UPI00037BB703|nr:hypothetical protein [Mastigocladopsis repens]
MRKSIISTKIDADYVNQQYLKFLSSLSVEFRFSLNCLLSWIHLSRQSRFDHNATIQAFEIVEQHIELQTLLLEQLLNWRLAPNEIDPDASSVSPDVDLFYQKLRKFQYSLVLEFKLCLNRSYDLTQQWRQGQLDNSSTIQALKEIEQNAKRQSQLLEKLLNWRFDPSELKHELSVSNF